MAQELDVNVHQRALRTAAKYGPDPRMQDTFEVHPTWWERIKHRWFKWERNLTVAGRTIEKGWVVPQPLGIALIIVLLGGVGGLYWRIIDKQAEQDRIATEERAKTSQEINELGKILVRLDQRLIDKQQQDDRTDQERKEKDELQDLQIKDVKDRLLVLNTKRGN